MAENLADFDELILRVRSKDARLYIDEAINDYKVGSFRSAIISAWLAVVIDLINKIRDLSLTGDKQAEAVVALLDSMRERNDKRQSLDFESSVLDKARNDFEFISLDEHRDLNRLYDDRNRCAHPSLAAENQVFSPSPELARTHIRNALEYLLCNPPVQGKAALEMLYNQIKSDYFPIDPKEAAVTFQQGPLLHARASLVRAFTIVLLKKLLRDLRLGQSRSQHSAALGGVLIIHRAQVEETIKDSLSEIINNLEDNQISNAVPFLEEFPFAIDYLNDGARLKLETYTENMPGDDIGFYLSGSIDIPFLKPRAMIRVSNMSETELRAAVRLQSLRRKELVRRVLDCYADAANWENANAIEEDIVKPCIKLMAPEDVEYIIVRAADTTEVSPSFGFADFLKNIVRQGICTEAQITTLLISAGIDELVHDWKSSDTDFPW